MAQIKKEGEMFPCELVAKGFSHPLILALGLISKKVDVSGRRLYRLVPRYEDGM